MTLTTARVDARVQLDSGTVLRLLPAPTPRWPDLLTVHSDADRTLFSGKVRAKSMLAITCIDKGSSAGLAAIAGKARWDPSRVKAKTRGCKLAVDAGFLLVM